MLMPLLTVKPAALQPVTPVTAGTVTAVQPQPRTIAISGLQSEAVLKIMETLNRHFMGEEVLPPEALTRLIETLAKVLKLPPMPQESTTDFARRLALFIETMPPEARQAAEKQLGLRSLGIPAKALAEALRNPNGLSAAQIATMLETAPQAASGTGQRHGATLAQQAGPKVQLAAALAAALAAPAAEVSALQASLKRTFGAGDEIEAPLRSADGKKTALPTADLRQTVIARQADENGAGGSAETGRRDRVQTATPLPVADNSGNGRMSIETRQTAVALPAQQIVAEATSEPVAMPETMDTQDPVAAIAAAVEVPEDERILAASPGLADVISHLPERAAEALSDKLAETLKDFADIAAAILPETEAEAVLAGSVDPATLMPLLDDDGLEIATLLAASFEDPKTEAVRARHLTGSLALPAEQAVASEADTARSRQQLMSAANAQPHDMPMVFRNGEMAVARALIPFAMVPYLPAANDIISETEENRRPYERDTEDDGAGDGQSGSESDSPENGKEEAAPLIETRFTGELPAEDHADNEAYQFYVRMGGILQD
ncbi:hypothetical protein [Pararhizobium sp.]|uniref:hypothetical protein n=1 Tax=Pararhizobium sp. TaxID=1977563 RepID=UPI00272804B4|nr:hypothetical protein [Pararhizobium sp.]MDO9416468.1 hypothetical protein [Pararhizobium sp.]